MKYCFECFYCTYTGFNALKYAKHMIVWIICTNFKTTCLYVGVHYTIKCSFNTTKKLNSIVFCYFSNQLVFALVLYTICLFFHTAPYSCRDTDRLWWRVWAVLCKPEQRFLWILNFCVMVSSLTDARTKEQGWLYIKSAVCLRNAARTLPTSSHFAIVTLRTVT